MQCEEAREQFADYVIDSVPEPLRSQLAKHLMICNSCRAEAEELTDLWLTLESVPSARPGPELQVRFDVMLEAYKHGLAQAPVKGWRESVNCWLNSWWPQQPITQFGLALTVLALGVMVGYRLPTLSLTSTVQPGAEISELRGELSQMRQLVALSLMQQQSASDRIQGINWSYQLRQPGQEILTALLDTLMHDSNVNVRLATIDALRQFGDQPVVRRGIVQAIARQEFPMVQMALIDLAVDLHETDSAEILRQLSRDQTIDETVRARAQKGFTELE